MNTSCPGSLHIAPVCIRLLSIFGMCLRSSTFIHACIPYVHVVRLCVVLIPNTFNFFTLWPNFGLLLTVGATNLNTHVDACKDCTYLYSHTLTEFSMPRNRYIMHRYTDIMYRMYHVYGFWYIIYTDAARRCNSSM